MLAALKELMDSPDGDRLSFEERLGLLVDREITSRENRQLTTRLKKARLRQSACVEDVDFRHRRGLDQQIFVQLYQCGWIKEHNNVLIIGPTGWERRIWPVRWPTRPAVKAMSHSTSACPGSCGSSPSKKKGDGRYTGLLKAIARADLLVLDDWGLKGFSADQQHDLLEVLDDRHGLRSMLITSQLPTDHWHELITNSTVADAICDRLVHNAYRITLKGETMRKTKNRLT